MKHRPHYPLIILYAFDWSYQSRIMKTSEAKTTPLPMAWLAGWLIQERKDGYVISFENFDDDGDEVRNTNIIPRGNVLFKRIIPIESIIMEEKK